MRMEKTDVKKNVPAVWKERKVFGRWQIIFFTVILGTAFLVLTAGSVFGTKAGDFSHGMTIRADDNGFDMEVLKEMMAEPDSEYTFAAWKEETGQQISAAESGRSDTANVIEIYGPSYCILPYGVNLGQEDKDSCLIGKMLAEQLFGGYQVEGQQIQYHGRMLIIRGVLKEPGNLMICETAGPEEDENFNRISVQTAAGEDGYMKAEEFISRYGLMAQPLRFDFYQDLSWIQEMIPAKWSDFAGWKTNIKSKKQEMQIVSGASKSDLEELYLGRIKSRNLCLLFGTGCLSIGFIYGCGRLRNKE